MIFILTIIVAGLFAAIGLRKGFFTMWGLLFNLLIAIYLSVMLSPTIIGFFPRLDGSGYYRGLCLLSTALVVFFLGQMFVANFLIGQVSLPKICNNFGSVILGILAGFFVANFVFFVISVTPISTNKIAVSHFSEDFSRIKINSTVQRACKTVSTMSLQGDDHICEPIFDWLTTNSQPANQ